MANVDQVDHEVPSVARKTCEVCGRTELVSQPGPDAFVKWKVVEGTLCPRCAYGAGALTYGQNLRLLQTQ